MAFTEQKNEMIRKDLLDEALRCAVTIGMRRTSVEQLTEAVGIAKGSFYKVFPSKDLLFYAVLGKYHAETYAVAEKALQDNAELPPTERATKIILAACKYLSDTKAMTFIENDAEYLLRLIPADIKAAHYHDDEVHIRQIMEASGLVPKGGMDPGCRHRPWVDLNRFPSGGNWRTVSAGVGNAGAWCLQGII